MLILVWTGEEVTSKPSLTNAEKQKRWRERHKGDKDLLRLFMHWYDCTKKSQEYQQLAEKALEDIDRFYEEKK